MKIWNGYGSEHSMNLVMIGVFKDALSADTAELLIKRITAKVRDSSIGSTVEKKNKYTSELFELMEQENIYYISPLEFEQFLFEVKLTKDHDKLKFVTDEDDISAFIKIMLHREAKIEIYSAHDYPEK